MEYYVGQIFEEMYPSEAADWCNEQGNVSIDEIEPIGNIRRFQIQEIPEHIPTHDEQSKKREAAYIAETDPIQTHIDRLKDGEQTPEIVAEIEALRAERDEKIAAIKQRYPYPVE